MKEFIINLDVPKYFKRGDKNNCPLAYWDYDRAYCLLTYEYKTGFHESHDIAKFCCKENCPLKLSHIKKI